MCCRTVLGVLRFGSPLPPEVSQLFISHMAISGNCQILLRVPAFGLSPVRYFEFSSGSAILMGYLRYPFALRLLGHFAITFVEWISL